MKAMARTEGSSRARQTTESVAAIVRQQIDLDVVGDGEQSKVSFQAYAAERLSGLEPMAPADGERRTRENMSGVLSPRACGPGGRPAKSQARPGWRRSRCLHAAGVAVALCRNRGRAGASPDRRVP
jgi:hypothetical protein